MATPTLTLEHNQKSEGSSFEHGDPTLDSKADNVSKIKFWEFPIPRILQIFLSLTPNLTLGPFQISVESDFQHGDYVVMSNYVYDEQIKTVKLRKMEMISLF